MKSSGFNENKLNEAIKNLHLENVVNQALLTAKPEQDKLAIKYNVTGCRIRELFFKLYPDLGKRTDREQEFAKKKGYIRTWCGPVRHLQELRYMSKNVKGEVQGPDKKLYSGMFSHACNNATNSPIQTAEIFQAMPDATAMHHFIKKLGLRSRLFNYVHDSQEDYVFKCERGLINAYYNYLASIPRQPAFSLPMHIDLEESDPNKGATFREGEEINIEKFDIKKELADWCKKFNKDFTFDDIDAVKNKWVPLHGIIENAPHRGKSWKPHALDNPEHEWEIRMDDKCIMYGLPNGDYFKVEA